MIKKKTNFFVIPLTICALIYLALSSNQEAVDMGDYSTEGLELDFTVSEDMAFLANETKEPTTPFSEEVYFPNIGKTYIGFKEAIAFKESRGNYFTVNTLGYLGKYQFGAETLKLIGIYNPNQFLYNPELQEKAFLANAERNKWILRKDIKRFVGTTINGISVTESGILAAAHLAGPGSVKKFLRSSGVDNFKDAYGTSVKYYMKRFSGYDTSHIVPNKTAKAIL
ncbi:peptidoglycan-binding protein LysM [Mangrovimonas sp. DI 80]|uniref:peptidoglycan-binding protein LysM n=1 Tax=Mangrovimonas sp. DI 80 TaxID=1779330 RepID=UPI000976C657|nr:peptidoglycan-binding protein LysM [Mangrovimonas sp. DI 80]OMP29805.1 peptidoglycan-binding protein LysM [Mangrovimonas sp. DI 80]